MVIQHKPSSGMMTAGLGESGVVRYDDASNRSHYAGGRRGSFSPMTHNLPDLSLPPDDYKAGLDNILRPGSFISKLLIMLIVYRILDST